MLSSFWQIKLLITSADTTLDSCKLLVQYLKIVLFKQSFDCVSSGTIDVGYNLSHRYTDV